MPKVNYLLNLQATKVIKITNQILQICITPIRTTSRDDGVNIWRYYCILL